MFTRDILFAMFKRNNGYNFIINTNEAEGQGINGVSYSSFVGYHEWDKRNSYCRDKSRNFESTSIGDITDSYIMLYYTNKNYDNYYDRGTQIIFIPLENITSIRFITMDDAKNYPTHIQRNELFD